MTITAGIDVGSGAVKAVVLSTGEAGAEILSHVTSRIRRRDVGRVVEEVFGRAVAAAGVREIHYIATTGEGEDIPFATGHFYGMTTHARGALYLEPRARAVLDVGALHARAVAMDGRGRVLDYKMTSQCASGSGQFLENIARYLGVSQAEVGSLSLQADAPEMVSSICAVLAETDVINMVSRGVSTPNILRGIHESMAERFARLLRSLPIEGTVFVSGGLSADVGLIAALEDALAGRAASAARPFELATHDLAICAGAIGAAIWGDFRHRKLGEEGAVWTSDAANPSSVA
ncbi:MAG: benzoyl-CoA reductase subunit D [Acidobacteriia bacterium]|nr:benzoyl-CoA reductase subunit D [Terriglobia bacterium]